jgi:hypothetical protein
LTGITDTRYCARPHIVPWANCETDALRPGVHNEVLLSALWDAIHDAGFVSFDDRRPL